MCAHATGDMKTNQSPLNELTVRERQVLIELIPGKQNKEIAQTLCISEATVESHLSNIYRKLGVNNRTEAAFYASRAGLDV